MNTRNVLIGVIVIIIIAAGIYYFTTKNSAANAANSATQPAAAAQANPAASDTSNASSTQVQAQDVTVGTGTEATPGSIVSVLYVGKLADGTVFDSSAAHGNQPMSFQLGTNKLIPGFQIGVNGMKVGGERLMAIPPSLGYGTQDVKDDSGKVIIPANSTIIFDVKLVSVEASSTAAAATSGTKTTAK